ncbi:MAG: YetF domain-containing protein [Cyanobacteria bacterium P01_D01_bin.14]
MDVLAALFDGWSGIIKILIAAPVMYVAVIAAIRIVGKRSTSQMNNFDWVVTVAIGSLTASGIILDSVTVIEALTAIALLLGAQYLLTKSILSSDTLAKLVKTSPTLLVHDGHFVYEALRRERVTPSEVMAALRENGLISIDEAKWVILETDATFSVIPKGDRDFSKAKFEAVSNFPPKGK